MPDEAVELPTDCVLEITVRPLASAPAPRNQRTLDLLSAWEREDETLSAEQRAQNKRVFDEIEAKGIARTRV